MEYSVRISEWGTCSTYVNCIVHHMHGCICLVCPCLCRVLFSRGPQPSPWRKWKWEEEDFLSSGRTGIFRYMRLTMLPLFVVDLVCEYMYIVVQAAMYTYTYVHMYIHTSICRLIWSSYSDLFLYHLLGPTPEVRDYLHIATANPVALFSMPVGNEHGISHYLDLSECFPLWEPQLSLAPLQNGRVIMHEALVSLHALYGWPFIFKQTHTHVFLHHKSFINKLHHDPTF